MHNDVVERIVMFTVRGNIMRYEQFFIINANLRSREMRKL